MHAGSSTDHRIRRTHELWEQIADCSDNDRREQLLEQVVLLNMGVALSLARRYRGRGLDVEDLEQVACLALTRAVRRFEPSRENDFLAFAVPTIRGELKKHFRDHGWSVRPPRRIQELQGRILNARPELTQQLGRSPRPSELAAHLGEDPEAVNEALATDGCFRPTSLDRPVATDSDTSMGEQLGEDDVDQEAAEARVLLGPAVRHLSERDRLILGMRFVDGCTQQEIADEIGVTQMHVSRLLSRIFAELREEIGALSGEEQDAEVRRTPR